MCRGSGDKYRQSLVHGACSLAREMKTKTSIMQIILVVINAVRNGQWHEGK